MLDTMSDEQMHEQAKKTVEAKRGFYAHLTIYVLVNTMLVLIWAFAGDRGFPWFVYPLGGWGIGIVLNFLGVFVFGRRSNAAAIQREVESLRAQQR